MIVTDAPPYLHHEANVLIDARIKEIAPFKSVGEIAIEVGYTGPHVIAMIRHGEARLSLDRVQAFARALSVDPLTFLIKALNSYSTDLGSFVSSLCPLGTLSGDEIDLVAKHREHASAPPEGLLLPYQS